MVKSQALWLPFVHCLEAHGRDQGKVVDECAAAVGISSSEMAAINACRGGAQGQALHLEAGKRTASLVCDSFGDIFYYFMNLRITSDLFSGHFLLFALFLVMLPRTFLFVLF